ncbi:winged helix-turn-helix domain-containing protein [Deinococcus lacus]|uniref:Winged helix-turn-helix domain-containing protein n=1 Tax=Deinococcus lacus TaxID=392561 RepID=A0ABW1YDB1_9DEIO
MPQPILGSYSGEWLTLTTPEQARLLSDPAAVRHLYPFIGRTLSTSEAAREIGVSTERMMYRVKQFLAVGLLEQVSERRRQGRPVRLYRTPGGLRVPFALTPFEDLEAQLRTQTAPYERLRRRGWRVDCGGWRTRPG